MRQGLTAVVPTTGASPWLGRSLAALREDGGSELSIVLVHQGGAVLPEAAAGACDEVLRLPEPVGFAAAANLGLARVTSELVALVNDDAVVQPGWSRVLIEALRTSPAVAAAQGVNLKLAAEPHGTLDDPGLADGWGIGWNRAWQAVQLGRDEPPLPLSAAPREVFGVSATAALFRRAALEAVALPATAGKASFRTAVFEPLLESYYEDVDLAVRLRAAGHRALCVPAARALHAGSVTGSTLGRRLTSLIHGNRWLVLARLLGRSLWPRLPLVLLADLKGATAAMLRGHGGEAAGIAAGMARALVRMPGFASLRRPLVPLAELRRFSVPGRRRGRR